MRCEMDVRSGRGQWIQLRQVWQSRRNSVSVERKRKRRRQSVASEMGCTEELSLNRPCIHSKCVQATSRQIYFKIRLRGTLAKSERPRAIAASLIVSLRSGGGMSGLKPPSTPFTRWWRNSCSESDESRIGELPFCSCIIPATVKAAWAVPNISCSAR